MMHIKGRPSLQGFLGTLISLLIPYIRPLSFSMCGLLGFDSIIHSFESDRTVPSPEGRGRLHPGRMINLLDPNITG